MISKDESIVTQVAAKLAAELVTATKPATIEAALGDYGIAFTAIREQLADAHNSEALFVAFQASAIEPANPQAGSATSSTGSSSYTPPAAVGPVEIVLSKAQRESGYTPEPLPAWVIKKAASEGVAKVFDNRATAIGTKRPWFKEALSEADQKAGKEPVAFWLPKGA